MSASTVPSPTSSPSLGVAVVGAGNWGRKLIRAFAATPGARIAMICDPSPDARGRAAEFAPHAACAPSLEPALADASIGAVLIATPPASHAALALAALRAGRHVFVEKPMALSLRDAEALVEAAERCERRLMVGHILEFHPAVTELRRLIAQGELGEVRLLVSRRLGAGPRRHESAWWSLGPHDVSLTRYLLDTEIRRVDEMVSSENGAIAARLETTSGASALLHLSNTSQHKIRRLVVFGTRRIALFDDVAPPEHKLRLFDVAEDPWVMRGEGEAVSTPNREPLRIELEHFVAAIGGEAELRSDGSSGAKVVAVLEAGESALRASAPGCGKMGPDSLMSTGK